MPSPLSEEASDAKDRKLGFFQRLVTRGYPAYLGGAYSNACPFGGHAAILTKVYTDRRAM
jgi:hypothetical protein